VLHVGPTVAVSASGVAGELREAIAITEIGEITAGGGIVELRGLRWEAVHRSGDEDAEEGSFSIGSATIGGTPVPTDDPTAALAEINAALNPLGLTFRPPSHHVDQTSRGSISTVDPLEIALIPSDGRSAIVDPVLGGLQPVRTELFNQLIEQDCGNATYVTVLDIVLNSTGSGGEVGIQLGGVRATTAPLTLFSGLGQLPPLPPLSSLSPSSLGGRSGSSGASGASGTAAEGAGGAGAAGSDTADAQPVSDVLPGTTGGPMLAVSAAGLGALAAAAEGDRRKMRRAQREIPVET
jgi:hypothetical protein